MAKTWLKRTTGTTQSSWSQPTKVWLKTSEGTSKYDWSPVKTIWLKTTPGTASSCWIKVFGAVYSISSQVVLLGIPDSTTSLITLAGTNYVWTPATANPPSQYALTYKFTWFNGTTTTTLTGPTQIPNGVASTINTTNNSSTITVSSFSGIVAGMTVVASGIPSGTKVTTTPTSNSVSISNAATATATGVSAIFSSTYNYGPLTAYGVSTSAPGMALTGTQQLTPNVVNTYSFVVTAPDGSNSSSNITIQGPTDIGTPTITTTSQTTATLTWNKSTGANRYLIYASSNSGVSYTFWAGVNPSGNSTESTTLSSNANITFNFNTTTYSVVILPITGTTNANPGYYGNLSNVATSVYTTQVPNTPTGGTISSVGKIRVYWYASVVDNTHDAATNYYVKVSTATSYQSISASTSGNSHYDSTNGWYYYDFPNVDCTANAYTYYVYASNISGNSGTLTLTGTSTVPPTPTVPTNISTSTTNTSFTINATLGSNTTSLLLNFGPSPGNYTTYGGTFSITGTAATITITNGAQIPGQTGTYTLVNGSTYYYQITPLDSACPGPVATGSVTMPPADPVINTISGSTTTQGNFFIYSTGAGSITVKVYRSGNGTGTSGYGTSYGTTIYDSIVINSSSGYYYIPTNGYYYITATSSSGTNGTGTQNAGGTIYSNYATGTGQNGNPPNYGSNGTTPNYFYCGTPLAPISPSGSVWSSNNYYASISWTAPTDSGTIGSYQNNVASYEIYLSTSNSTPSSGTTATLTGITGTSQLYGQGYNSTYYYWVRSRNLNGASAWVSAGSVTTPLGTISTAPTYGSATGTSGGWTASVNNTPNPSGGTYSYVSATAGSATVNSSTGAITASGLGSNQSSTVTVKYSVTNYNPVNITASGTSLVAAPTINSYPSLSGSGIASTSLSATSGSYTNGSVQATGIAYGGSAATLGLTTTPPATHSSPYTVTGSDASSPAFYFWPYDQVLGTNGITYYCFGSSILSSEPTVSTPTITHTSGTPSYSFSSTTNGTGTITYYYCTSTASSGTINNFVSGPSAPNSLQTSYSTPYPTSAGDWSTSSGGIINLGPTSGSLSTGYFSGRYVHVIAVLNLNSGNTYYVRSALNYVAE